MSGRSVLVYVKRRTLLTAFGAGTAAGLSGCLSAVGGDENDGPCTGDSCDIGMSRMEFLPREYEVTVGDTVVWKNTSGAEHTVTAYEGAIPDEAEFFDSGDHESEEAAREGWAESRAGSIPVREIFEYTFEVPGTYEYFCIPHERGGMVGTITVTE